MPYFGFICSDEIVEHLAEHDVSVEDFEYVVRHPERIGISRSSGRPCCWGETVDGRQLLCVYEHLDDSVIMAN